MCRKCAAILAVLIAAAGCVVAEHHGPPEARIQMIPPAHADGEVKAIYDKSIPDFNKAYNFQELFSLRPDLLATIDRQYRQLMLAPGEITQRERVFVAAVVSLANGDRGFAALQAEFLSSMHGGARPDMTTLKYNGYLTSYDPKTRVFTDHGSPDPSRKKTLYFHGMAVDADGCLYVGETDAGKCIAYKMIPC